MVLGGILLAVIANMILGMLYYSSAVFAKPWMKLTGVKPEKMEKDKIIFLMGGSALLSFVTAGILAFLIPLYEVTTIFEALLFGFIVWLGFSMPTTFLNNMYQLRSVKLSLIDSGYQLIGILAMSSIVFFFI